MRVMIALISTILMSNSSLITEALQAFSLQGKRALITGASSGIGAQQARALGRAGASLVLLARSESSLQALQAELEQEQIDVTYEVLDLGHNLDWQALAAQVGHIDILCNTAGVNLRQATDDITSESWDMTQHLNVKVPFMLAQALVPSMAAKGWGRIINVASLQSFRAFDNGLAYGASKGAVAQMTRAMAQAWSQQGINCNAIAPGFFPTELTAPVFADEDKVAQLASQTAIGRNGELTDLDGICVFLASGASAYITGQIIAVDGGYTAI